MNASTGIALLLDYEKLDELADKHAATYQQANPFPHIVFDDFINHATVAEILSRFPRLKDRPEHTLEATRTEDGKLPQPNKLWLSNQMGVSPLIRRLYWELNSAPFMFFLERLTGISNLIADPHMSGGGVHETKKDGFLMVHADFNKHPQYKLDRRINLLIYLNPEWQEQWGGQLELWSKDVGHCEKRISPLGGRCAIFSTSRDSFHGHPHPLACPENQSRKSIALYYYTNGRPPGEDATPHKTLWHDINRSVSR